MLNTQARPAPLTTFTAPEFIAHYWPALATEETFDADAFGGREKLGRR